MKRLPVDFENSDPMDLVRAVHVNLTAPMLLLQALLPLQRENPSGSRIVLVVEDDSRVQHAFWGGYGVARAGLGALLKILAEELDGGAVKLTACGLGPMRTNLRSRVFLQRTRGNGQRRPITQGTAWPCCRDRMRRHMGKSGLPAHEHPFGGDSAVPDSGPAGNIPVFLSLLKPLPAARRNWVLGRELLIALIVLLIFLWAGQYILSVMHLRQESVSIAGGSVLFLIGIRMIFPTAEGIFGDVPEGEPFFVPMAIPLVAGPSGMAAVMLMGNSEPGRLWDFSLALPAGRSG